MRSAKKAAISLFIAFHIIAITCWSIPSNAALVMAVRGAVRPYMLWSGLFQAWDMFAPSPRSVNAHVEAAVILRDGRIQTWKFPRMEQLSLPSRSFKERYRKFVENLQEESHNAIWPDVARYIARANNNPSDPPQIVMLIRYWSDIVPEKFYRPRPERARIFFEYNVKPEDLR
ncbi:MAG TPA: hypothetical protein VH601_00770 [Bryobacteraceae bacterium]|jgi:hypothetical protein